MVDEHQTFYTQWTLDYTYIDSVAQTQFCPGVRLFALHAKCSCCVWVWIGDLTELPLRLSICQQSWHNIDAQAETILFKSQNKQHRTIEICDE